MMVVLFTFISLCAAVLAVPCVQAQTYGPPVYETVYTPRVERMEAIPEEQYVALAVYKDMLVAGGYVNGCMLHLFDRESGEYVTGFARAGNDAGEFSARPFFQADEKSGRLTVVPAGTRRVIVYDLEKILDEQPAVSGEFTFRFPLNIYNAVLSERGLLANGACASDSLRFRMGFVDPESMSVKWSSVYADIPFPYSDGIEYRIKRNLAGSMFAWHFNPERRRIVAGSGYGMVLEIFDVDSVVKPAAVRYFLDAGSYGVEHRTALFPVIVPTGETVLGYRWITSSDRYIYTLNFCDRNGRRLGNGMSEISVFDWQGNPVALLEGLPRLLCIASGRDGCLFGIVQPEDRSTRYIVRIRTK